MKKIPNIALTCGCPCGVGPELASSISNKISEKCEIAIYGDYKDYDSDLTEEKCGKLSFEALDAAVNNVLNKKHDAVVTCPINKHHWKMAGIPFTGHTEYLANKTGTRKYAMMMASPNLKVTLATIHEALRDIPDKLTPEKIITATILTHDALVKSFGIKNPRIAVAGLNPHCGDHGLFGKEEESIIKPALEMLVNENIAAFGPFPADSIFGQAVAGKYDAVVAMYHDQGLAAVKTLDYKNTVNITLGIPIIRTSVDHGTAEDISGKGVADNSNLIAAINMAIKMIERSEGRKG